MSRARVTAAAVGLAILAGTSVAYAASLTQTSARLTVYAQCLPKAAADATVDENSGTNQGTATELSVRSWNVSRNMRSLVYFDLTPCGLSSTSQVNTASLDLFMTSAPPVTRTYDAHRVTATWDEGTVIWANQPATAGSATASTSTGTTSNVWLGWNVLADVGSFAAGTASNLGWRIKDQVESDNPSREGRFGARENATVNRRPRLVVNFYP